MLVENAGDGDDCKLKVLLMLECGAWWVGCTRSRLNYPVSRQMARRVSHSALARFVRTNERMTILCTFDQCFAHHLDYVLCTLQLDRSTGGA